MALMNSTLTLLNAEGNFRPKHKAAKIFENHQNAGMLVLIR